MPPPTVPYRQPEIFSDPDLVDRMFEYLLEQFPQIPRQKIARAKADFRDEFGGEEYYVRTQPHEARARRVAQILALFNGRNATEIARKLQISRATVYRIIKQAGKASSV